MNPNQFNNNGMGQGFNQMNNMMGNQFGNCMPNMQNQMQFNQNMAMGNNNMMNNMMMNNPNTMNFNNNMGFGNNNMNNMNMMPNNMTMMPNNMNMMQNNMTMMPNNMNMMQNNMNMMGNNMNMMPNNMNMMGNMNMMPNMNMMQNNMNMMPNMNMMNNNANMDLNNINNINNPVNNPNVINNPINVAQQQEEALKALKKKEAEERRKLFSEIINKESGENLDKISTISDMANMGSITRNYIEIDSSEHPEKYIPFDQAFSSGDEDYFILGIVADYLKKQSVVVAIEKRDQNQLSKQKLKEIDTFLQFLINGLTNLKKHEFRFEFGWEKNNLILTDITEQDTFMNELKVALSKGFNIKTNEVIITYPRSGSVIVTVIFTSEDFNNITVPQIQNILSVQSPNYNNLLGINSMLVLDGILLNPALLDHRGDNKNQGWGYNEKRGGRPYIPPKGWIGYGLKVWGKYDKGDNNWIGHTGVAGEWCVAYHGASQKLNQNYKQMRNVDDANHPGQKVGEGVYCSPNPNVLDQEGGITQVGNKRYKIGFMLRVRPDKIRIAKTNPDYWVLDGTSDEIRPYRILIKQI